MNTITVGNVEITALQDTPALMNAHYFFPDKAEQMMTEFSDLLDERGLFTVSITCYLLRSAGKTYIVDTGVGPRRRSQLPRGHLDERLDEAGIAPGDIDVVLNTHLHVDHVGWNTIDLADGSREIFFPGARFYYQQVEWDYWMAPERMNEKGNEHLVECVEPLRDSGRITFADGEVAIDENLTYVSAPGHTPGHVAIGIHSRGERAIIAGDASHHPVHLIHPDWSPRVDYDGEQSARSRVALFERAIDEDRTWIAGHWPFPGFGRIHRLGGKRVFTAL